MEGSLLVVESDHLLGELTVCSWWWVAVAGGRLCCGGFGRAQAWNDHSGVVAEFLESHAEGLPVTWRQTEGVVGRRGGGGAVLVYGGWSSRRGWGDEGSQMRGSGGSGRSGSDGRRSSRG